MHTLRHNGGQWVGGAALISTCSLLEACSRFLDLGVCTPLTDIPCHTATALQHAHAASVRSPQAAPLKSSFCNRIQMLADPTLTQNNAHPRRALEFKAMIIFRIGLAPRPCHL